MPQKPCQCLQRSFSAATECNSRLPSVHQSVCCYAAWGKLNFLSTPQIPCLLLTIQFILYLTVWGVEPVVTHQTSWPLCLHLSTLSACQHFVYPSNPCLLLTTLSIYQKPVHLVYSSPVYFLAPCLLLGTLSTPWHCVYSSPDTTLPVA